jgi:hypothetical protein
MGTISVNRWRWQWDIYVNMSRTFQFKKFKIELQIEAMVIFQTTPSTKPTTQWGDFQSDPRAIS